MEARYELTDKQDEAFGILISQDDATLLYGGAKGGGKSWLFCLWVYYWTKRLIEILQIPNNIVHPLPVGFMGRKRATDFEKTTFETWKRVIPASSYIIKTKEKEIIIDGKVKVMYGGLDDQDNINKFNSAELAFIALDQSEETDETDLGTVEASLRLIYNGIRPPYKILYTANPAENHIKHRFIDSKRPSHYFIPALYTDNKYLPENYRQTLENAFAYDDKILRAYRDGDWTALKPLNQLISQTMINMMPRLERLAPAKKKIIAIDPSTGGDACVLKVFYDLKVMQTKSIHENDTMKIVGEAVLLGAKHECQDFVVDIIGVGHGVVDRLNELKQRVIGFNSSESASDPERFYNKRAEAWWLVAQMMMNNELPYIEDIETHRQLIEVRYKVVNSNGQILLEPKEQTKKRLGRSPDDADAYIYGVYGSTIIPDNVKEQLIYEDRQGRGELISPQEQYTDVQSGYG